MEVLTVGFFIVGLPDVSLDVYSGSSIPQCLTKQKGEVLCDDTWHISSTPALETSGQLCLLNTWDTGHKAVGGEDRELRSAFPASGWCDLVTSCHVTRVCMYIHKWSGRMAWEPRSFPYSIMRHENLVTIITDKEKEPAGKHSHCAYKSIIN